MIYLLAAIQGLDCLGDLCLPPIESISTVGLEGDRLT
jgi:hypothetical protein